MSKYKVLIDDQHEKEYHINIYQETLDEYYLSGTLSSDVKTFYLLFKKEDEERLPLAIPIEISDETFSSNQYQFLKFCPNKSIDDLPNLSIQFPDSQLSIVFSCELSPSYPFPVDIKAVVKLKSSNEKI